MPARPYRARDYGGSVAEKAIWFIAEVALRRSGMAADMYTVHEVARQTGRSPGAILKAVRDGRLSRAERAVSHHARRILIHATSDDLEGWRVRSTADVLREHPDLPQDPAGWVAVSDLAGRLRLSYTAAATLIRRTRPRELRWRGGPFREEVRYWIPDALNLMPGPTLDRGATVQSDAYGA
jgi:hypothetical protein